MAAYMRAAAATATAAAMVSIGDAAYQQQQFFTSSAKQLCFSTKAIKPTKARTWSFLWLTCKRAQMKERGMIQDTW
jgi:hypothetical protein